MIQLPERLERGVSERIARYDKEQIGRRAWQKDHTIWKPEPTEISDRLGWLGAPGSMLREVDDLLRVASDAESAGYQDVMLLGMGGSSLAPEVIYACLGGSEGRPGLVVLDTTNPSQIQSAQDSVDIEQTLFLVASKSGGTVETMAQYHHFRSKFADARRFMAITDGGSGLEQMALAERFFRLFLNDPEIGGRYSALSFFGMVPAVLTGADIETILHGAVEMAARCGPDVAGEQNPGAWLGIVLGEAALAGRDKLTIVLPEELRSLGGWIEQLIAESTGKEATGILPVEGEAPMTRYGDDRIFVVYGEHDWVADVAAAGHPVIRYPAFGASELGAEFYRWEYATAVACWVLGVNPFDQPNVQEAKDATAYALAGDPPAVETPPVEEVLATVQAGDYIALCAFVPRDDEHAELLQRVRTSLGQRYGVPVTAGFGPRYLHSTGQLHKGGPNTGVFLHVIDEEGEDLPIPGKDYTFKALQRAQAQGDVASLLRRGRRVARIGKDKLESIG